MLKNTNLSPAESQQTQERDPMTSHRHAKIKVLFFF